MYFVKSHIAMSGTEMLLVPGLFRRPLLAMKEGLVQYEHLINIKGVKGLNEVSAQNGTIKIGALCTHHQLERSAILRNHYPRW